MPDSGRPKDSWSVSINNCRSLIDPNILGVIGPGFPNKVPTLDSYTSTTSANGH